MPAAGFLTPKVDGTEVLVQLWIALQAELLRDAVVRGDPAATGVLGFANVVPQARGAHLDLDTSRLAIARITGTKTGQTRSPTGTTPGRRRVWPSCSCTTWYRTVASTGMVGLLRWINNWLGPLTGDWFCSGARWRG